MKKKKKKNCSTACRAARECFVQVLEGLRLNESPWTSGGYADIVAEGGRALQRGQSPGMASGRGVIGEPGRRIWPGDREVAGKKGTNSGTRI